jgi:hypothetical protein
MAADGKGSECKLTLKKWRGGEGERIDLQQFSPEALLQWHAAEEA